MHYSQTILKTTEMVSLWVLIHRSTKGLGHPDPKLQCLVESA